MWALPLTVVCLGMLAWIGYELWRSYRSDRQSAARQARDRSEEARAAAETQSNPYTTPIPLAADEAKPPPRS